MTRQTDRLIETRFEAEKTAKWETLMCQGNGYMGLRGALEEDYYGSCRGFYIAGTYNKADKYEVSELPNMPDALWLDLRLDGELFRLDRGTTEEYSRSLDLKTGEMIRTVRWESTAGRRYKLVFKRFVSSDNLHLFVSSVEITPLSASLELCADTGINGRVTNSGAQNLSEVEKRVYENRYMQYIGHTSESDVYVYLNSVLEAGETSFISDRRRLYARCVAEARQGKTLALTKKTLVYTSLDKDFIEKAGQTEALKALGDKSYGELLAESLKALDSRRVDIEISGDNSFDQLALNFALYHLNAMIPAHDARFSVGAKGLTGEGYKGHVFWDTEIFILPYVLYNSPETARRLLEYRSGLLDKALEKARKYGYEGALFPWESALTGDEETPEFAQMNIKTGTRERVHSADKEHHISSDIAYAVLEYEKATDDREFMREHGIKLLKECARFWVSRADNKVKPYTIKDVIGPDEYTEHIDNNAYTNYMAFYVVNKTIQKLEEYGDHDRDIDKFKDFAANIYLPEPDSKGVIPQDDSFMGKPVIDLEKYRRCPGSQLILRDYTRSEVVAMQILKQADAVMLLFLLPELFSLETHEATWKYYEPKTIHDSSLSMSVHSITAARAGLKDLAYACFEAGERIDLGEDSSCGDGIHAAAAGAVYMAVVMGFAGIRVTDGGLSINPVLPKEISRLNFPFVYRGNRLRFDVVPGRISVTGTGTVLLCGEHSYTLDGKIEICY